MKFVLARNFEHFLEYCKKKKISKDSVRYVDSCQSFQGYEIEAIILCGWDWLDRKDASDLLAFFTSRFGLEGEIFIREEI